MHNETKWIRVTRSQRCPICNKDSWCCIGEKWINCMRIVSERTCTNGGYLHPLNGQAVQVPAREDRPTQTIDADGMMRRWFDRTSTAHYDALALALGVAVSALIAIKCAWAPERNAWAWPMRSGAGNVVGIRLRGNDGKKLSVTGGHEGVFLPMIRPARTVFVTEGPTDLCALLTMGLYGIGRPSCSGGIAALSATIARLHIREAVIIADNDRDKHHADGTLWNPGIDGAKRLANDIGVPCCIVILPVKDVRAGLNMGMKADMLDSMVKSSVWHQPTEWCRGAEAL